MLILQLAVIYKRDPGRRTLANGLVELAFLATHSDLTSITAMVRMVISR
jgi:hypothetical protein